MEPMKPNDAGALPDGLLMNAPHLWPVMARHNQSEPLGPWDIWLLLGGRGSGKTRSGAEWVRGQVWQHGKRHVALVGPSIEEARHVMLEGESGLLNIGYASERPKFIASRRRLEWPNGATGHLYSAADPDALRGPQFDCAWADEFCAWQYPGDTLSNLRLALRLGSAPKLVVTTTPKPLRSLAALMEMPGVTVSRSKTYDNTAHLAPSFLRMMKETYGGTTIGRQEIDGEIIDDPEGGLWTREMLKACHVSKDEGVTKTIIAVDPPGSRNAENDACGIIVAGYAPAQKGAPFQRAYPSRVYILHDGTVRGLSTGTWAGRVMDIARGWDADYIVAEKNIGGDMVEDVLRQHDRNMRIELVTATKNKRTRAEPVAMLYEQSRVLHASSRLQKLEDELIQLGSYEGFVKGRHQSPDRADALVWAVSHLLVKEREGPRVTVL